MSVIKFIVLSELRAKIFGKALGIFMLTLEPIIMALLYYLLTSVIFKYSGTRNQFVFIFVAVIFWRWFSRTVDASPGIITGYGSVLKQTNFLISLVVYSYVILECVYLTINFVVLMAFLLIFGIYPTICIIYLPLIVITQFLFMNWLVLLFAVAGTFIKDLGSILFAFTSVWWYMSPGIYPISSIPQQYLWIYYLNPFAHIIPAYQKILVLGEKPELMPLMLIALISLILSLFCQRLLKKARYYFFTYL